MKERSKTDKYAAKVEHDFLAAYDEYADALFRHCSIRVRDKDAAHDLVQETFTKSWDYLAKGKKVDHLRAFLYCVANNLIVDQSRKKKSASLDSMMEDDGFEAADEDAKNPAEIGDSRYAMSLLATLDEVYRSVITLRFVEGLSPKEIAHTLGISENVVSVRIHRGIERLKSLVHKPR